MAPPRPSPDAELTHWECDHYDPGDCAAHGLDSYDYRPFGRWMTARRPALPESAFQPVATGDGYTVTVPFQAFADDPVSHLMVFGRTIWVGWRNAPAAAQPRVRRYTVTVERIDVFHRFAPRAATEPWHLYGYVNGAGGNLLDVRLDRMIPPATDLCHPTAGYGYSPLGERQFPVGAVPRGGSFVIGTSPDRKLCQAAFDVTVVEGQPLHVKFLAARYAALLNDEAGTADCYLSTDGTDIIDRPCLAAAGGPGRYEVWPVVDGSIRGKDAPERPNVALTNGMVMDRECRSLDKGCFSVTFSVVER